MAEDPRGTPGWLFRGRIPALDGLRAISIVLVLAAHAMFAASGSTNYATITVGSLGVDVFFVISGFLITLLLVREQQRTATICFGGFYRRRALRILPAYLAFLAAMYAASRIGWEHIRVGDWIASLTYTMNWRNDPAWALGHVWSLSMEEQFYLLWPPLILLMSRRTARRLLVGCIALAPVFRVAARVLLPHYEAFGRMSFPARVEPIAAGCLLALLATDPVGRNWLNRWFTKGWVAALAFVLLAGGTAGAMSLKGFGLVGRSTLSALLIPILVWWCANADGSFVRRLLDFKPVVGLGILSYSIYLWQQPFLDGSRTATVCRFPYNVALALLCALGSYWLIERPFLKIKDHKPAAVGAERELAAATV